MAYAPQIPFDFSVAEAPGFDNFVVGDNGEAIARLSDWSQTLQVGGSPTACVIWGGSSVGKSHLLRAAVQRAASAAIPTLWIDASATFPPDPFVSARMLAVDDADRLSSAQQAWLFTAFNHVAQQGGLTLASGQLPPARWPMRDDIRSRLASGLAFELLPIPHNALPDMLADYTVKRGFRISNEALTYLLNHSERDVSSLCKALSGIDRYSLAAKRAVTVPLVREYLSDTGRQGSV